MKHKFEISKIYYQNGQRVCDAVVEGEVVEGVKATELDEHKCNKCKKWCYGECDRDCVARTFECEQNKTTLHRLFNVFTGLIFAAILIGIFKNPTWGFFGKLALAIGAFIGIDIISTGIEGMLPKLYDEIFYRKLNKTKVRNERLLEAARKKEEALKQKEEAAKLASTPNYEKVIAARTTVQRLKELSDDYHYGPNEAKINTCVEKCEAILNALEEDSSSYRRVSNVFELWLPEICSMLEIYTNLLKAESVTQAQEDTLTECVDTILQFLETQRVRAIVNKEFADMNFDASATVIKNMLRQEIDKEENDK